MAAAHSVEISRKRAPDFVAVFGKFAAVVVKLTECAYNILFCYKSGNRGNRCFPAAPAKRNKQPSENIADFRHKRIVNIFNHTKAVFKTEGKEEPDNNCRKQNNRTGFFDE